MIFPSCRIYKTSAIQSFLSRWIHDTSSSTLSTKRLKSLQEARKKSFDILRREHVKVVSETPLTSAEKDELSLRFSNVLTSSSVQSLLEKFTGSKTLLHNALLDYQRGVLDRQVFWSRHLLSLISQGEFQRAITPSLTNFLNPIFNGTPRTQLSKANSNMKSPETWYPQARSIRRRIVYHAGPTNSGKTYHATEALKKAKTGIYCAPLRLLAFELYEKLNHDGVFCNLLTGQERKYIPGATHASCTIEMAHIHLNEPVDVAVIDEIQMIGDDQRGWAWTEALLSLEASEIHLCGDATVVSLIEKIARNCNDTLEVIQYERLTPLVVSPKALRNEYKSIKKGDCVVVFSRKEIFVAKQKIEEDTGLKCCVVYGNLPPEIRSVQAKLFNSPNSHFDVLVASDAIGMGLNLNIKRIVFETLKKFNGESMAFASPSSIKQIAGRAGRAKSIYPNGEVTCLSSDDLPALRRAMTNPLRPTRLAGLFPTYEHIERFANLFPDCSYSEVLERFFKFAMCNKSIYFPCDRRDFLSVSMLLDRCERLSLEEKFFFSISPIDLKSPMVLRHLVLWIQMYNQHHCVYFDLVPIQQLKNSVHLVELEAFFRLADLYQWFSQRLTGFLDVERVLYYRENAVRTLNDFLGNSKIISRETKKEKVIHQSLVIPDPKLMGCTL